MVELWVDATNKNYWKEIKNPFTNKPNESGGWNYGAGGTAFFMKVGVLK